jgi:hypothetical protein
MTKLTCRIKGMKVTMPENFFYFDNMLEFI